MSGRLAPGRWDPAIRAGLQALLDAPAPGLAVFDWDDTCVRGDVGLAVLRQLDAESGADTHGTYFRLLQDPEAGVPAAYPYCTEALAGRTAAELDRLVSRALDAGFAGGQIRLIPEMADLIDQLHARGWEVWVVSASPTPAVRNAAARAGIPANRVLAMTLTLGADRRLVAPVIPPLTYREGKLAAIDATIGRRPDLVAGDSLSDLAMLRASRHRLVIAGHEPGLPDLARAEGWWVQPDL